MTDLSLSRVQYPSCGEMIQRLDCQSEWDFFSQLLIFSILTLTYLFCCFPLYCAITNLSKGSSTKQILAIR
jgi:hypothetical protein